LLGPQDIKSYQELLLETANDPGFSMDTQTIKAMSSEVMLGQVAPTKLHICPGAFCNQKLLGFGHCSRQAGNNRGVLWGMYVAEGQRCAGVGHKLLTAIIEAASVRLNLEVLELTTDSLNQAAIHLYSRHGFKLLRREQVQKQYLITYELKLRDINSF